jgi:hypothetical protein
VDRVTLKSNAKNDAEEALNSGEIIVAINQ